MEESKLFEILDSAKAELTARFKKSSVEAAIRILDNAMEELFSPLVPENVEGLFEVLYLAKTDLRDALAGVKSQRKIWSAIMLLDAALEEVQGVSGDFEVLEGEDRELVEARNFFWKVMEVQQNLRG